MKKRIALIALLLALCACDRRPEPEYDYGSCLQSHESTSFVPIYTTSCSNNICTPVLSGMMPITSTVCDAYEFPNGDGPGYYADLPRYKRELAEWQKRNPEEK